MEDTAYGPDLSLSSDQEGLLRAALSSNPRGSPRHSAIPVMSDDRPLATEPAAANTARQKTLRSPEQVVPGSATFGQPEESPFLDYELEDGAFDWDTNGDHLFGNLPGEDDHEPHDKRKASLDDDGGEDGGHKRREGEEKGTKKPGRKPLMGEPTTKRKAQNRAAQRAFRERKERHLKDLETKVDDLEKASEATNHENGRLRAQVEKLSTELKEYRKRISLTGASVGASPPQAASQQRGAYATTENTFAFPKFGDLPSSFMNNGTMAKTSSSVLNDQQSFSLSTPGLGQDLPTFTSTSSLTKSPTSANGSSGNSMNGTANIPPVDSYNTTKSGFNFAATDFGDLNGLFSPSILESASRSNSADYVSYKGNQSISPRAQQGSISSNNGSQLQKLPRGSSNSTVASPTSMHSSNGLDSSCGTTPDSCAELVDNNKATEAALNTITEEPGVQSKSAASVNSSKTPNPEFNGIDWMAQQNGGQFDPVLFGDYRDPQDSILNAQFGDFFNDAFPSPQDFTSPYYTANSIGSPDQPPKRDLMSEIEIVKNNRPEDLGSVDEIKQENVTCEALWNRMQASGKIQDGSIDMDDLCSQLRSKAKCSSSGASIDKKEADKILGPALG